MEIVLVNLIVFLAGLVQGLTGFGSALVAMPLLLMFLQMKTVAPLVAGLSLVINGVNFIRTKKSFEVKKIGLLTVMSLLGIPMGAWLLKNIDGLVIKKIFGWALIGLAVYLIKQPELKVKFSLGMKAVWGVVAGLIGGVFNVNGPLVVSYFNLEERDLKKRVNALASYFLITGAGVVLSHFNQGLWRGEVKEYFWGAMGMVLLGTLTGSMMQERLKGSFLALITNSLILLAGVGLLR